MKLLIFIHMYKLQCCFFNTGIKMLLILSRRDCGFLEQAYMYILGMQGRGVSCVRRGIGKGHFARSTGGT